MQSHLKIGVVGACGTGKSELVTRLRNHGYHARHIAQEHSYAPSMWRKSSNPDILVYLHISFSVTLERVNFKWTEAEYKEQLHRLRHARANADLIIDTDNLTPEDVYQIVLLQLAELG
jgi:dephospho-CoA kinase